MPDNHMMRPKILTCVDHYIPGFKAGGPIRTIANMVEQLGDEFSFDIITRDREEGDTKPYPDIIVDSWQQVGKANVMYISPRMLTLKRIKNIFCDAHYDIIYLNSLFSPLFTINILLLRRLGLIPNKPCIVAPRGEFASCALAMKKLKKRIYLFYAKSFGLYRNVTWQASSQYEKADIQNQCNKKNPIIVAPDFPPVADISQLPAKPLKLPGQLKCIFLARLAKNKNLDFALKILRDIKKNISFNIYGPEEDPEYWTYCQSIIHKLPGNITVTYHGIIEHGRVLSVMREHDLFFLPTSFENYGHVIIEALLAGCPVLISDRTPWRNLEEKGVGWDIPLEQPEIFNAVIKKCADMNQEDFMRFSERAQNYGSQSSHDENITRDNRNLFLQVLSGR